MWTVRFKVKNDKTERTSVLIKTKGQTYIEV